MLRSSRTTLPPQDDDVVPPALPEAARPAARRGRSRRRRETLAAYAFLAPDLLGLLVFVLLPMGVALGLSLFEVDGFGGYIYVGLDNFRAMAGDDQLWQSIRVTLAYVAMFVPASFLVSLGLALLVRNHFRGIGAVRAALFLPNVVSLVVIGLVWQFMLTEKRGVVPDLLAPLGLGDVSWLGTPSLALITLVVISVWFLMGYQMLILLGGLKDIPAELEDAARIDGAGAWQRFRYVVWPLLRPTSFFVVVNATIGAVAGVQGFDLVYVLTQGGPAGSTSTLVFYIYQQAFTFNHYGYAAALTVLSVGALLILTGAMFAFTRGGRFDAD